MSKPADFISWVTDPQRTNDELFTVELLLKRVRACQHWPFRDRNRLEFEEKMKMMNSDPLGRGFRHGCRSAKLTHNP